jgi:hypothetical protein
MSGILVSGIESEVSYDAQAAIRSYLTFTFMYCLAIVAAILLGAPGGLIPTSFYWFWITSPIIYHVSSIALGIFISFLPLLIVFNLNFMWFRGIVNNGPPSKRIIITGTVFGTIMALPLLMLMVYLVIVAQEVTWGLWEAIPYYIAILWVVVLIYVLLISVYSVKNKRRYLASSILNPRLWAAYFLVFLLLLLPIAAVLRPFSRGYFQYIPLADVPDLFLRALLIALVLPALSLAFVLNVKPNRDRSGTTEFEISP